MVTFVQASAQTGTEVPDPLLQVAEYLEPLLVEYKGKEVSKAFTTDFVKLAQSGGQRFHEIIKVFLNHADVFYKLLETQREKVDGCCMLIISLLTQAPDEEGMVAATKVISEVFSDTTVPAHEANAVIKSFKLRCLQVLYSAFPSESTNYFVQQQRFKVFKVILQYCSETSQMSRLKDYLNYIESWAVFQWRLNAKDLRRLYLDLASALEGNGLISESLSFLRIYAGLYEKDLSKYGRGDDEDDYYANNNETKDYEEEALVLLLKGSFQLSSFLIADDLLKLKILHDFKGSGRIELMVEILELLKSGTVEDMMAFRQAHPDLNVDYDQLLLKIRLLCIATACEGRTQIDLADIGKCLALINPSPGDTEQWVVRAIAQNVVEGRVDQTRGILQVKGALQRTVGIKQWTHLEHSLKKWLENVEKLKTLMADRKIQISPKGDVIEN